MELPQKWTRWCVQHPKQLSLLIFLVCLGFSLQIPRIQIDTDPENMLSREEFVRIFHNRVKRVFTLHDMIVLGVVNESHPDGVFNPGTLKTIHTLTQQIERIDGVIPIDLLAPSKVDDIQQAGLGTVRFQWLMSEPPKSREEALHIRDRARDNPLLNGTLLSEDGKALCLYIPVRSKDLSYVVSEKIRARISKLKGDEQYHITGLPVAEDTFGVQMFRQMAVSAPLAGLFLFLLMWFFFRKPVLIFSALIVAGATVVCTMGLLIGLGFTVHIMSSMIPIFLMPIAVVDSIHILSEFFDRYQDFRDRVKTMEAVMAELFRPMLFTSLTSAAGFASLALTPIPPVRVFGLFVAFGILLAWVLTITFIPAYIMFLPESSLTSFGRTKDAARAPTLLERGLGATGQRALRHANPILGVSGVVLILSIMGITQIQVNDNPVKWFEKDHPIRVADRILNRHFGGTYMAYLVLNRKTDEPFFNEEVEKLRADFERRTSELKPFIPGMGRTREQALLILEQSIPEQRKLEHWSLLALLEKIESRVAEAAEKDAAAAEAWNEIALFFSEERVAAQPFKNPEVLRYMESLQDTLRDTEEVGKATSVVDVVKKVHYELREGDKTYNRVPDTAAAVAQTLLSYQNSHDPDDLWHLVTPGYDKANLWIQLKSGDNRDMERVERRVDRFFRETPPPLPLEHRWAGLTYLNVVWQDKMVRGMLRSLMGSFLIVLLMVTFLFRSPVWGLLCMVPLAITITFIYGLIGFAGKDYDMPIAVLSAMTLGLSVDFAIHFLERSRVLYARSGHNWAAASREMFGEPARAIVRNILVIALGFTPLLVAPLVPYQTVGVFLASIMAVSGVGTLVLLPALVARLETVLFR